MSALLQVMTHEQPAARSSFWAVGWLFVLLCGGCNVYSGTATTLQANDFQREPGWIYVDGVPELRQAHELDCGPTALAMVLEFYGIQDRKALLEALPAAQRSSVKELRDLARKRGFKAFVVEGKPEDLVFELKHHRPVIVGVAKPTVGGNVAHYEVVVGMNGKSERVATLDPALGLRQNTLMGFFSEWQPTGRVLLVIVPPPTAAHPPVSGAP